MPRRPTSRTPIRTSARLGKPGTWQDRLWIAARYAAYAAAGYLALVLVLIVLFRFINPPGSMLMLTKLLTGNSVTRTWVPLEQISPALVRAVIVSEDDRFCEHSGIDAAAMKVAIERASGGIARGASTISMQVTKNLFLWNAKSYIRKVIEIPLTLGHGNHLAEAAHHRDVPEHRRMGPRHLRRGGSRPAPFQQVSL